MFIAIVTIAKRWKQLKCPLMNKWTKRLVFILQHHQFDAHESEQTVGDGEGQGSLACCSPRGRRVTHDLATAQSIPWNVIPANPCYHMDET